MRIAFLYGDWCLGGRAINFDNLYKDPRGLTGSEVSFIKYASHFRKSGCEVDILVPSYCISSGNFDGVNVYDINTINHENSSIYDCVIAWNEPDLLRRINQSCLRVVNQQLNDFDYCLPGFESFVDIFTSPSSSHLEFIRKHTSSNSKWFIIPNGVDTPIPSFKRPSSVIYTSSPDRGLHILLEIWPGIKRKVPDSSLRIFYNFEDWFCRMKELTKFPDANLRECSYRAMYIKECLSRLSSHGVEHFGSVSRERISREVLESEIMAYPCDPVRYTEGFSVSLMEGCASGCAVVTSDADAIPSIYQDGSIIIKNVKSNKDIYADEIIRLLQDDEKRSGVQESGRNLAKNYTWDTLSLKFLEMISSNLKGLSLNIISPENLLKRVSSDNSKSPVLLISPPSPFLIDERVFIGLGLLKVASSLESAGYPVEFLDLSGVVNYLNAVEACLCKSNSRAVAITYTTPQYPSAVKISRLIRERRPDLSIIIGGPHPTLVHSAYKSELKKNITGRAHSSLMSLRNEFDVVVSGDGEISIFEALRSPRGTLIDADDIKSGMFMDNNFYNNSPYPARHLVDLGSYKYSIEGHSSTSIIAQLGCPYGCNFCGGRNSHMLRRIRTRTTDSIISEIEFLYRKYGYTGFNFFDDELNVNKSMVSLMNGISDLQSKLGKEFRLRGFVKSELFNDEQAESMYRAGFRWVLCGFESASPRILENINKKSTLEDNTNFFDISRRHSLKVKALMSVGHAGESEESILSVRDWLLKVVPDDFDVTVISCYPGTPYYDDSVRHESISGAWTFTAKKSGDRLHSFEIDFSEIPEYYKGDPDDGYHSYVFTDYLSGEEIVKLRNLVESEVREKLSIPFNIGRPGIRYEHSMGQGPLPSFLFKKTLWIILV